jgi:DNA-binding GntR family transcriptional regulator
MQAVHTADRAYDFAKARILDGRYAGGEILSEGGVAEEVGVSRTPVREAFIRLETEGLLRLYPKRGALVVPVSPEEAEHVMDTRLLIETHAIDRVIRREVRITERLRASLELQAQLAGAGELTQFVEADREFHRIFVAAAGNPILLQLHDSLRDRQSRLGIAAIARDAGRLAEILDEHHDLAAAVLAGDADRARRLIDRHLERSLSLLLRPLTTALAQTPGGSYSAPSSTRRPPTGSGSETITGVS